MVAFASLILDDLVEVKNFRIVSGSNGLFVSAPQTKSNKTDENGKNIWYPDVRFLGDKPEGVWHTDFEKEVFEAMLLAYNEKSVGATRASAGAAQVSQNSGSSGRLW